MSYCTANVGERRGWVGGWVGGRGGDVRVFVGYVGVLVVGEVDVSEGGERRRRRRRRVGGWVGERLTGLRLGEEEKGGWVGGWVGEEETYGSLSGMLVCLWWERWMCRKAGRGGGGGGGGGWVGGWERDLPV